MKGDDLKTWRLSQGMKQEEACWRLKISLRTYKRYEKDGAPEWLEPAIKMKELERNLEEICNLGHQQMIVRLRMLVKGDISPEYWCELADRFSKMES